MPRRHRRVGLGDLAVDLDRLVLEDGVIGGAGSDLIEGRGGDDVINGDAWLNTRISVRANDDGTGCAAGNWRNGWIVLAGGNVVHHVGGAAAGFRITETSAGTTSLVFQSTGVDTTPASFTVCRATPSVGNQERVVTVDATGRAVVRRTTTGSCP